MNTLISTQCESRTGSVSSVGHYDLSSLSEDSDSGTEPAQALEQYDGEGEGEGDQDNKIENRTSLTSSILKQVQFLSHSPPSPLSY